MSRSYHSNIRKYINEKKNKYSNEEVKEEGLNQIGEEIFRKRFTKKNTVLKRKIDNRNIAYSKPFNPCTIEIKVLDEGQYIHFPASKDDLLGVIRRLPHNIVSGIHSITLCLGKEYQEDKADNFCEETRDPFTARICADEEGPIFTPPTLGTYYTGTCKIFIYAYVYDREELKLDIIEPYLRLQMLSTLVHEIAHHEDNIVRTSRGRWLGFNDWKSEDYAEFQQMNWSETAIIPYLMDTYPKEYHALSNWIEEHGGVRFSLAKLAGESKGRRIGDKVKLVFSASSAVMDLFKNVVSGMSDRDSMLEFAKDLHYGDYYEECLKSLDAILIKNPEDSEALGVKSDTYIHQEEYIKAENTAKECLFIDHDNTDALEALCDVKQHMKDWKGLKEISRLGIESAGDDVFDVRSFTEIHIIALLYLREYEEAIEDVENLPANGVQEQRKLALDALVKVCSGNVKGAFTIVNIVLKEDKVIGPARSILKAVNNYISITNQINVHRHELSEYEQNYVKNTDIKGLFEL
jgi:tetratricopeptide (TPR) repeat protein